MVKIGVVATAPDLTSIWNRHHLADRLSFLRPLPALRQAAQDLRARGADVVLALAHMGFGRLDDGAQPQNELSSVSAIPEIDAVVGGHTHQRFPDRIESVATHGSMARGLIHGTPVVQPGASGSDLGQIDLTLTKTHTTDRWNISSASSELITTQPDTPEDPGILNIVRAAHDQTCAYLNRPAARLADPMNTFFALAQPSPVQGLLAAAKRSVIQKTIAGTELENLPLLAAASATLTGGLDGPGNFIALQNGELKRRHIAGMNPYANQVWAVRTTGARLLDWLERSAVIFNTLSYETPRQMLINADIPGFRYDALFGLTYEIDPREAPRFDAGGHVIPDRKGRVSEVQWQNRPLDVNQEFLVAITDHRAGGGGIYQAFDNDDIVLQGHCPLQSAVLEYLKNPSCEDVRTAKPWRLKTDMGVSAILLSAPEAESCFDDVSAFAPQNCGLTESGFLRVLLHL